MRTILRARYVFPVAGDPIADGAVSIEDGRIVACDRGAWLATPATGEVRDLGNAAILPGLVNAHVHLDFGNLPAPLGHRGIGFADWVRLVMALRRDAAGTGGQAVAAGLDESLRGGVTALADIVQPGQPPAASPIDVTALLELIAPSADRVAAAVELAKSHLGGATSVPSPFGRGAGGEGGAACAGATFRNVEPKCPHPSPLPKGEGTQCNPLPKGEGTDCARGLSPHAPYSVHPDLLAAVVELSNQHQAPVAMHLAESPEELQLLRHGCGPLRVLLEELGAWDATAIPRGTRPLDYLRLLARAHCAIIVHGTFLNDEEIALLAAAEPMSVVYCPRTCDWFAYGDYPLEKLLAAGARVALGTDGRGSSPDLSLLGEMRSAAGKHPGVPLSEILKMATINAAATLGRQGEIGSIAPGKRADLAVVALPHRSAADPHQLLFDPAAAAVACYCRGAEAYRSGKAAIS